MASKKKAGSGYGNKTSFVMNLPREMSARDVVAKAKAQGMILSEAHVYKIRSTNKSKGPGKIKPVAKGRPIAARKAAAAGRPRRAADGGVSKRDFVLSFPAETPAATILKQAKASGVALSKAYLYTIRAGAKGKTKVVSPAAKRAARSAAATGPSRRESRALETQFIDAALDLGLSRASELIGRVRAKLREV